MNIAVTSLKQRPKMRWGVRAEALFNSSDHMEMKRNLDGIKCVEGGPQQFRCTETRRVAGGAGSGRAHAPVDKWWVNE